MSAFSWILISDLHLKSKYSTWSQNVVLRDMVRNIKANLSSYPSIRFVIVSGDLAHGGKPDEYKLVESFLDDLIEMLGLTRADVFMVAGNHDIDRDICALAFHGCRSVFDNPEEVEKYLSNDSERASLMKRLSAFYAFEQEYCKDLKRTFTDDKLAYLCVRNIDTLPIGVIGLNSALTCGNDDDERKIIVGDRPIIDICEALYKVDVRLVIGILHHPPEWLREFDKRTLEQRFFPRCDIVHRGHLHEQEATPLITSQSTQCLLIAAGASFVWRQFENSYSVVTLDVEAAECTTVTCEYESASGAFPIKKMEKHSVRLRGEIPGSPADLHNAICALSENAASYSPYLASILNGTASEVPVPIDGKIFTALPILIDPIRESIYAELLKRFLNVKNSLLAFPTATPIAERVRACGTPIVEFSAKIAEFTKVDGSFAEDISKRVESAARLYALNVPAAKSNFIAALEQCANEHDWDSLETIARRYESNVSPEVRLSSQRHLALALANSDQPEKKDEGIQISEKLIAQAAAAVSDFQLCFAVHRKHNDINRAEAVVLAALDRFGTLPLDFSQSAIRFSIENGRAAVRERIVKLGENRV